MARQTYVQHPKTGKLVPLQEVDWDRHKFRAPKHFSIMEDIEPFVSPVDGSVVTSRSRLREHNDRNGVVNFHEFDGEWEKTAAKKEAIANGTDREAKQDRINDLIRAWDNPQAAPTETIDNIIPKGE